MHYFEQEDEEIINEDTTPEEENVEESQDEVTEVESKIPDKYRGKSIEDIIAMHQNSEKELSRLGNEVGDLRKYTQQLLQSEQFRPTPVKKEEEEDADWDYEPQKATKNLVNREVGEVKQELNKLKQETALEKFKARHPNFDQDSRSPEFIEWVQSSKYRTNLYTKNYNGIDLDAAEELMSGWDDYKSLIEMKNQEQHEEQEDKRQKGLKAASMEKGSSTGSGKKKIWRSADIIRMRLNAPDQYEKHYDEIQKAYAEDRVK